MSKSLSSLRLELTKINYWVYYGSMFFLIACSCYQFFSEGATQNFYAWIIYNFQNLYTCAGVIPIFYLVTISLNLTFTLNDPMYLSRIKSRRDLFLSDCQVILKTTSTYLGSILIICSAMGLLSADFRTVWDRDIILFFKTSLQIVPNQTISLPLQTLIAIFFMFLYLLTMGTCYNLLLVQTQKKTLSFSFIFLFICIQSYFFRQPANSTLLNVMPIKHYLVYLGNFISIKQSILYWSIFFTN